MIDVAYYLFNSLGISSQPGRLMLLKWVKVSEERFNEILSTVTKAKKEGLKTSMDGREIMLDNTERLLKDSGNGILDKCEFKKKYNNIFDNEESISKTPRLTRSQNKMLKILSVLKEIVDGFLYEESDTTNMPELESEESAAKRRNQPGKGLKILTPGQMLSRLPISLAQLKAGNNSQKLGNEIRQLLYSLYRSKKLTKQIYKSLVEII